MPKAYINPPSLFSSLPYGFSQAVASPAGRTVYLSGQVAWDAEQRLVGGADLKAQTLQALRNVEAAMRAAGGTLHDVVALRLYVVGYRREQGAAITEALRATWPSERAPASTWIGVSALAREELLVEVEATAVIEDRAA